MCTNLPSASFEHYIVYACIRSSRVGGTRTAIYRTSTKSVTEWCGIDEKDAAAAKLEG